MLIGNLETNRLKKWKSKNILIVARGTCKFNSLNTLENNNFDYINYRNTNKLFANSY